jgi:excisionase family DNA binding protein
MSTKQIPVAPLDPLRRYSIDHALLYLGVSRAQVYKEIKANKLATIKDGRRRYIPGSEIVRRSCVPA